MDNFIEDQKEGLVPKQEMPDIQATASDLKSKGYTKEQVVGVVEQLGLSGEATKKLVAEFDGGQESPVELNFRGGSDLLSESSFQGTDLLGVSSQPVVTETQAKQQVFMAAQMSPEQVTSEDMKKEVENFLLQGGSPLVSSLSSSLESAVRQVDNQQLLNSMGDSPQENAKMIEVFSKTQELEPSSTHQKILEQYAKLLPQERLVPENTFEFISTQIQNLNNISTAANIVAMPLQEKGKFLKDVGEILTPFYGEGIFLDFQNALAEDNYDVAMQLLVGSEHLDRVAENYWKMPPEEQMDYVNSLLGVISERDTAFGTDNTLLKLDLISKIYDKITEGPSAVGEITSTDAVAFLETFLSEVALAVPLVKIVKDMIRARRLSRILNFDLNTPSDLLEKPKAKEGEWVGPNDPIYSNGGTTTTMDVVTTKSPASFEKLTDGRDIKDVVTDMGVDPKDMPSRILPNISKEPNNPAPSGVHHHYLSDPLSRKIQNNHLAIQLQEAEVAGLLPSFVEKISTEFGDSLVPHLDKSYFEALEDPEGLSLGSFVVRLGQGKLGGFNTAEDAEAAAKKLYGDNAKVVRRTPYGNFSEDLAEGKNVRGEFYVELRQEHQMTPLQGKGNFLGSEQLVTGGGFKPILNYIFDDDLLFNDRIQKTYSVMRDRANAFGVELSKQTEDLVALATSPSDVKDFNLIVNQLQSQEVDTLSVTEMTTLLGKRPSKKVIKALDSARLINSANWEMKNTLERAALVSDRYKTVLIGENRFISQPLFNKPESSSIKGTRIYDPESNTDIPLTQEIIDGLYEGGGVVAKLYKNAKTPEGEYTHIIVRNPSEQVKELQPDVVPYVKGHYERMYKDDGFIVKGLTNKKVNGKNEVQEVVLGITKTKSEANKLASALANRGFKLTKEPVSPTVEYASKHGLKTAGALSLEQSVSRGQRLKGWHGEYGEAETFDPFESYLRALHKTRNKFEQPVNDLNKARWVDRYRKLLKVKKFPVEITKSNKGDIFKDTFKDEKAVDEAINYHRRIRLAEGADMERALNWMNGLVRKVERIADDKGQENISKFLSNVGLEKINALGVGYASTRFIWGNPLYQMLSVVAQTPFLLSQGPTTVAKSLLELAYQFVPLMISREDGSFNNWVKLIANEKGLSPERVKKELQAIVDSGIVRTADVSTDFLSESNELYKTLLQNKITRAMTVGAEKSIGLPIRLMKKGVVGSIDMYELFSFLIAKNKWLKNNKGKDWTSPKALGEISYFARGLSLNQNDTARFAYQNNDNLLRFAMAMTSYTARMSTRMYVDPLSGGLMSSVVRPKGSRKVNPYTMTAGATVATGLIGFGMYGEGYVDPLDLDFGESEKEYLRAIAEGDFKSALTPESKAFFKNAGIDDPSHFLVETYYRGLQTSASNSFFDGDVNWSEKFHPASFIKMMYDKFLVLGSDDILDTVLGLPYAAGAGLVNTVKHNAKMLLAMEEVKSDDSIYAGLEFLSQLKIIDDAVAVSMAANLERRISKSSFSPREKTTLYEQLSKLAGGVPTAEAYSMGSFDKKELVKMDFDTELNYMVRKTQFDLYTALQEKGSDLLEEEATEIIERNFVGWASLAGDGFTMEAAEQFRRSIMVPSKPLKIGEFTITREIQEQGISAFIASLKDPSPSEWKEKTLERIGLLEIQIKASPEEVALEEEKEMLEAFLREVYNKDPEELNNELLEEYL